MEKSFERRIAIVTGGSALAHDCTEENWHKTININLKDVGLCMKHEIPIMLKQGKGTIVNVASILPGCQHMWSASMA